MKSPSHRLEHPAVRPRRLTVSGGSVLSASNVPFCEALGRVLAHEPNLLVVTGGLRHWRKKPDRASTDWTVVSALLDEAACIGEDPRDRTETLLPEVDTSKIQRFEAGRTVVLRNRTAQSRRFSLVNSVDAVLCIEGGHGTRQVIDLALAIRKPVLPVCFTGGAAAEAWERDRHTICDLLSIPDTLPDRFEAVNLCNLARSQIEELAELVIMHMMPALRRKCLVVMPFAPQMRQLYDRAIRPAIEGSGLTAVRSDDVDLTGSAIDALRQSIAACDASVVVLTGANPNVMYELGLVHAHGKPTILLCERGKQGDLPQLPFDLRSERVLGYSDDLDALIGALRRFLEVIFGPPGGEA